MSGWEGLSRALRDRKFAGLLLLLALGIGLVALSFFLPGLVWKLILWYNGSKSGAGPPGHVQGGTP